MKGTLYGVGVGPGDPELITLAAVRVIESVPVLAVPDGGAGESVAWQIACQAVPTVQEKTVLALSMPMTRDSAALAQSHQAAAEQLAQRLQQGDDVAFLTLGDPSIYSTFGYLRALVAGMGYPTRVVAGVPSFCAAAARLQLSLAEGGEPLHLFPASYEGLEEALGWKGTKVLMKSGRSLQKVRALLGEEAPVWMVERCGMPGERVYRTLSEEAGYLSLVILKEEAK